MQCAGQDAISVVTHCSTCAIGISAAEDAETWGPVVLDCMPGLCDLSTPCRYTLDTHTHTHCSPAVGQNKISQHAQQTPTAQLRIPVQDVVMMVAAYVQTLQEAPLLAPLGPLAITPLSCAIVTDPDTLAVVTTRSDLVMIIDYVTGDRVVQDSDGTRVTTYASGGFMVESAGLPLVRGGPSGVSLEPMPGTVTNLAGIQSSMFTMSSGC